MTTPAAAHQDLHIPLPQGGHLLARRWLPPPPGNGPPAPHAPAASATASAPATGAPTSPAPIILLHESLGCISMWRGFAARLAEHTGRPVIAYDRWGFGKSSPRSGPMPADFVSEEARHTLPLLRAHLGFDRFALLGHSVGGCMAVHCAAAHPGLCEALITLSTHAYVDERVLGGIRQAIPIFANPDTRQRLARHHGDKTDWVLSAWIDTWLSPAFARWSLLPALAQVRCPTLVLHGSQDEYGGPEHPATIARQVQGPSQCPGLPGAGHQPHLERPDEVTGHIARFLHAHRPPAA